MCVYILNVCVYIYTHIQYIGVWLPVCSVLNSAELLGCFPASAEIEVLRICSGGLWTAGARTEQICRLKCHAAHMHLVESWSSFCHYSLKVKPCPSVLGTTFDPPSPSIQIPDSLIRPFHYWCKRNKKHWQVHWLQILVAKCSLEPCWNGGDQTWSLKESENWASGRQKHSSKYCKW